MVQSAYSFYSSHWLCVSTKPLHKMPGPVDTQNKLCFVLLQTADLCFAL